MVLAKIRRNTLKILSSVQQSCELATVLALSTMDIAQTAPDCFGFPDCSRSYQIAPDCTKLYIPTCSESCDMLPSCTKLYQVVSACIRLHQIPSICAKSYQIAPYGSGLHWKAPNCARLYKDCAKMYQITKCAKSY